MNRTDIIVLSLCSAASTGLATDLAPPVSALRSLRFSLIQYHDSNNMSYSTSTGSRVTQSLQVTARVNGL
jgi:hypothetical protein